MTTGQGRNPPTPPWEPSAGSVGALAEGGGGYLLPGGQTGGSRRAAARGRQNRAKENRMTT